MWSKDKLKSLLVGMIVEGREGMSNSLAGAEGGKDGVLYMLELVWN